MRSWITRTLETHVENLELLGTASINGSGNPAANVITGNDGANMLSGLGGDDTISGGAGIDTIVGGAGADMLIGGTEADVFDYNALSDSTEAAPDEISDFATAVDKIDLSGVDADITAPKDQAFIFVGALGGNPGELAFNAQLGALLGDVDGGGADLYIVLDGVISVSEGDLIL